MSEQTNTITIIFTWRGFYRASFVMVAEAAMLAMVFESSGAFKVATLLCALSGLGLLQFEDGIKQWSQRVFRLSAWAIGLIYSCFVLYAIYSVIYNATTRNGLENLYVEGANLATRQIQLNAEKNRMDSTALAQFSDDVGAWQKKTADWLLQRMSVAAEARFLDRSSYLDLSWSQQGINDQKFDPPMNGLMSDRKNLAIIMETHAYDR